MKKIYTHVEAKDGWTFILTGTADYRTKTGRAKKLGRWSTHCKTCGQPFEVLATNYQRRKGTMPASAFGMRNCPAHRLNRAGIVAAMHAGNREAYERRMAAKKQTAPSQALGAAVPVAGDFIPRWKQKD